MRKLQTRTVLLAVLGVAAVAVAAPDAQVMIQERLDAVQGMLGGPQGRNFKTGTGKIRGRIVAAETGQPVRRVQVRLTGPEVAPKTMLTNADGLYEFTELPAGRFSVSATKSGYVNVQYGQTRPYESGKPIELADKQIIDRADIAMPRGSVIAGRIVDEFGEPLTDATVTAMRSVWSGGRRRLQPAGRTAQTNDLGQYRIFGLPPGDYYVSATFRGGEMMMLEMAAAVVAAGGSASNTTSGYATTYYPGTTSAPEAQRVKVAVGQEMTGADFALAAVKLAKVSGSVMRSDGQPATGTMVTLMPRATDNMFAMFDRSGRTDANGNFTLSGVSPGDYNLQVRGASGTVMTTGAGGTMTFSTRMVAPDGGGAQEAEFGTVPVTVAGDDVTNVIVVTTKGATATGRITFEGSPQPAALTGIRVMPIGTDNEPTIVMPVGPGRTLPGALNEDGTFELRGLAGTRLLRVMGLPPGWVVKSVSVEGQDATDTGFDFKPGGAISGVEIVATTRSTEVNGTVTAANGAAVKDFTAVLFADDPARWTLPSTRYVMATRPDQEGRFKMRNLPAGDYYAIAVEYLAQGEWGDPEVLERLKSKATRVTLNDGESKSIQLKMQN